MPKISVIMTIYNTDKEYLLEAIDSVLQQTYTDFELLLIDDGSTIDYTDLPCIHSDQRIIYSKLPENVGIAMARNFGLGKATGEFIAFLDSDDEYLKLPKYKVAYADGSGTYVFIYPTDVNYKMESQDEYVQLKKALTSIRESFSIKSSI